MKPNGYVPDEVDLEYIEATSGPVHPVIEAIEASLPDDAPILDRASGRVLAALAVGRRRILEIGTGFGYSTLWLALGQGREGHVVTIDVDAARLDTARGWWREASIDDARITTINRPALDALADEREQTLAGPFDLVFIDALKTEYLDYLEAVVPRLARRALVVADNALKGGAVARARSRDSDALDGVRAFNATILCDARFAAALLPVGDGLVVASFRL